MLSGSCGRRLKGTVTRKEKEKMRFTDVAVFGTGRAHGRGMRREKGDGRENGNMRADQVG
jgi:hypothetical protein